MSLPQQKYALDTRNPFTRADARAAGITVKELISSRYHKVFYNLYVSAHVVVTPQIRARAALRLASPDSNASHPPPLSCGDCPSPTMTTRTSPSDNTASGCVGRASSLISVKRLPVELFEPGFRCRRRSRPSSIWLQLG